MVIRVTQRLFVGAGGVSCVNEYYFCVNYGRGVSVSRCHTYLSCASNVSTKL